MSKDQEPVRPYHAKDPARGQEAAEAVAAVLQHAADREKAAREAKPPKKQPKWALPLGINLAVLALYLLIAPPAFVTIDPIDPPPPEAQIESLRIAMFLQAKRIEAYRIENGSLPASLDEAGTPVPGVEYRVQGEQYTLVGTAGEEALVYDSTESAADFVGAAAGKLLGG